MSPVWRGGWIAMAGDGSVGRMRPNRIYVPAPSADDWQGLLAEPDLHWKKGRSARALAHCWTDADGWPASFGAALTQAGLGQLEILLGLPEHRVPLAGGARPSQTDLFVLARDATDGSLAALAVEGKLSEPFGPLASDWLEEDEGGKRTRLRFLLETLGLSDTTTTGSLRYQLLHRTASAVIEARRFNAARALMIVHSFSGEQAGFSDYSVFAKMLGASPGVGVISQAHGCDGTQLWLGWVAGEPRFLEA